MLNRFVAAKVAANKRTSHSGRTSHLSAQTWQTAAVPATRLSGISKKVSLIQNEGLEEHKVRDMNDAINKLMRERGHWERQIKSLGGPDHFRMAPTMLNADDAEEVVPGKGYRYYGAAKKLPGVRELFSKPAPERQKRTRFEMMKGIDADYYGYRDDDDGVLEGLEATASEKRRQELVGEWEQQQAHRRDRSRGTRRRGARPRRSRRRRRERRRGLVCGACGGPGSGGDQGGGARATQAGAAAEAGEQRGGGRRHTGGPAKGRGPQRAEEAPSELVSRDTREDRVWSTSRADPRRTVARKLRG